MFCISNFYAYNNLSLCLIKGLSFFETKKKVFFKSLVGGNPPVMLKNKKNRDELIRQLNGQSIKGNKIKNIMTSCRFHQDVCSQGATVRCGLSLLVRTRGLGHEHVHKFQASHTNLNPRN